MFYFDPFIYFLEYKKNHKINDFLLLFILTVYSVVMIFAKYSYKKKEFMYIIFYKESKQQW